MTTPAPIGTARLLTDGTLVLTLRAETGAARGDAELRYAPHHPRYAELLAHIGSLAPGEEKAVPPWE